MSNRLVARRYAKALVDIAAGEGTLSQIQAELVQLAGLVSAHADLARLVHFPLIAPAKRADAFDAVLERAGAGTTLRRFFRVVTQAARLSLLQEIVEAYGELVDARTGVVEARVSTAHALTDLQRQTLQATLARRTGRTVRLRWNLDPRLLGGINVQLGSTLYDATLLGRLRQLQGRLLSA